MTGSVLIVDDSLTVRMDLAQAFEAAGFTALPCGNAAEARALASAQSVAIVILDLLLPDGDGLELLPDLRAACHGAPILMLTTEAEIKDRIRGLRTGADDYVGKPYDTNFVVTRARELLHARGRGSSVEMLKVMVVDDSASFRTHLGGMLAEAGYEVLAAATGEEGLALAALHRPHAIVLDAVLPGVDGATVIRRIRLDPALRRTPCLLLSGSHDRNAELDALEAGADAFVRKGEDSLVILARVRAAIRSSGEAADQLAASLLGSKRVLAVDDSPTYLESIATAVRDEGYDVVLARSGEQALELLAIQPVDCILLDRVMPGLGGTETCRRIKEAPVLRDIPVIMVTALQEREAMIDGLTAGADDYIPKDAELVVLKARLRAQLRRKHFEDENRRMRNELMRSALEASEARAARALAEARAAMTAELERKNRELEAFSYSVSHDLRAPLRSIDGFSQALLEDHPELDPTARAQLARVRAAAQRMGQLIDDLLQLSRVTRAELEVERVDLSGLGESVVAELRRAEPTRAVQIEIQAGLTVMADRRLLRLAIDNLVGNAWKFTSKQPGAAITLGGGRDHRRMLCFVRDNGAGFDMKYADKLFQPFRRLHSEASFTGTGIGLATVYRVIDRHGGRVWAEGEVDRGATFYFTLQAAEFGDEA